MPNDEGELDYSNKFVEVRSLEEGAPIAHGEEGVEFSIKLSDLGVESGAKFRMLLEDHAHTFDEEGYEELIVHLAPVEE